jgi:hypothetical protein
MRIFDKLFKVKQKNKNKEIRKMNVGERVPRNDKWDKEINEIIKRKW